LSRPFPSRPSFPPAAFVRVNGKIRAREVRVIGVDGNQMGIISLGDALTLARNHGVDLVEIAANANPPVCRLVDFGKYRYEQAKRDKESRKHQHANKVKEVQLSPKIDPHDLGVKIQHAVDFLCEDMKVKVTLKFRGREMAHTEVGFAVINKFLSEITPYGHPDFQPKLIGRGINAMISPLPRNKRAKNPRGEGHVSEEAAREVEDNDDEETETSAPRNGRPGTPQKSSPSNGSENGADKFANRPLEKVEAQS
jgi:translation initiation factor IF-3